MPLSVASEGNASGVCVPDLLLGPVAGITVSLEQGRDSVPAESRLFKYTRTFCTLC